MVGVWERLLGWAVVVLSVRHAGALLHVSKVCAGLNKNIPVAVAVRIEWRAAAACGQPQQLLWLVSLRHACHLYFFACCKHTSPACVLVQQLSVCLCCSSILYISCVCCRLVLCSATCCGACSVHSGGLYSSRAVGVGACSCLLTLRWLPLPLNAPCGGSSGVYMSGWLFVVSQPICPRLFETVFYVAPLVCVSLNVCACSCSCGGMRGKGGDVRACSGCEPCS